MLADQIIDALRAACDESSQSDVARRAGLGHGTVNDLLNRRSRPENMTLSTLQKLLPVIGDYFESPIVVKLGTSVAGGRYPDGLPAVAEVADEDAPADPLLVELAELWGRLPRSGRLRVLAAVHGEIEQACVGGAVSSSCDGRTAKVG